MDDPRLIRTPVLEVPITATNMSDCIAFIIEHLEEIRGEYICVSNAHTTVMAHDDPMYYEVQTRSIMSVPDGKPLSVVGRRKVPTMGRITGPDLMRELLKLSEDNGYSHFFYGNTDDTLKQLLATLRKDYPHLNIAGCEPSVFRELSKQEKEDLAQRISGSKADFIWIATGAPRQEVLCSHLKGRVNGLMVGVGGAFNILAGITPEAPIWMQNLSLEWLYRLIQEPRRLLNRYVTTNSKFLYYLVSGKKRRRASADE